MILVTGATGTNGRLVAEALRRAGARVRAMVQDPRKAVDLQQAGAEIAVADFDKPETLASALAGAERGLLLSAVDERLVEREARFVEQARKAGLRHLVKFSAIGADPAAPFTFGRQHGRSEQAIRGSGLSFTVIQPNFFMQNLLWSADSIKTRGELASTLGGTPVSHVDARDIAAVIAATLTQPIDTHAGRTHLVTGPAALTYAEVAEVLGRVLGQSVRYVDLSDEQLKTGLRAGGQSEWLATAMVELNSYARQGNASIVSDTIQRVTGRSATPLERWVQENASAFRS